jgi:hypothetical protein
LATRETKHRQIARTAFARSGRVLRYILWDRTNRTIIAFTSNKVDGDPDAATLRAYDANTTQPRLGGEAVRC